MPKVSICIPSYKPDFFEATLKSAVAQSYTDLEILVSDDCPTDAIELICDRYRGLLSYSRNPNPGEGYNIVRCFEMAQGEYIKLLFDDDVLNPFCVQYLVEALDSTRQHNTTLAFSPRYLINEANHVKGAVNHFRLEKDLKLISGRDFIRLTAMHQTNLVGEFSTVLLRRADCVDAGGRFSLVTLNEGRFMGPLDIGAWIELAKKGPFVGHSHPLSYFRQHDNSTSNPAGEHFIHIVTYHEKILENARAEGYLQGEDLVAAYRNLAKSYRYWSGRFPQLQTRITELEALA